MLELRMPDTTANAKAYTGTNASADVHTITLAVNKRRDIAANLQPVRVTDHKPQRGFTLQLA